jgi:hypothetical protein
MKEAKIEKTEIQKQIDESKTAAAAADKNVGRLVELEKVVAFNDLIDELLAGSELLRGQLKKVVNDKRVQKI